MFKFKRNKNLAQVIKKYEKILEEWRAFETRVQLEHPLTAGFKSGHVPIYAEIVLDLHAINSEATR